MVVGEGKVGLATASERIFGDICSVEAEKVGETPPCKIGISSLPADANSQIPNCPKCRSKKTWHNGHRNPLFGRPIQRWICRDCGYRFADPVDVAKAKEEFQQEQLIESNSFLIGNNIQDTCQICDEETSRFSVYPTQETKNLVTELKQKLEVPQKETYDLKDLKGAIINFVFYLKQQEKAEVTQTYYGYNLDFLVTHGANLFDPESVKDVLVNKLKDTITLKDKTEVRKYNLLKAYKSFAKAYGISLKETMFHSYKPTRKIPYLPPETHMDQLIASCSYEMAAFLQLLKETGARPVEAMRILWEELDFLQRKIPINHPAKGCNPRVLSMSEKLVNMLKKLPQTQTKVFIYKNERNAGRTFRKMRQQAITKTGIPELAKITMYTFRYWRATVEFQETQKEVPVMILLGHKSTKYLWLYVQLAHIYFGGTPKYSSIWVHDREQESKIADEGYTYIRTDPKDGASLYRKQISASAQLIGHD